ncbi:MAG: prohibitin family protein [Elusimicrobiota bacterium]|jgi:regulator of protease activity HflC (stomatin/prohibitin superfamily)
MNPDDLDIDALLRNIKAKYPRGILMEKDILGRIRMITLAVAAMIVLIGSFFVVSPGEVAIKTRMGKIVDSYEEGLHFKLPVLESITKLSIQIQRADIRTQAFSKDLQTMKSHLVVNHRIQKATAVSVYRNLGARYVETVVDPTVQEIFKSIAAKFSAERIIADRNALVAEINQSAKDKLMQQEIVVTDISVVDLDFTEQFLKAVEDKQVADQQAQMSGKLVEKAKRDAEQQIAKSRGEAEALRMQREQVTPSLIELRKVDAQLKAIEKWNGVLPGYVGAGVPFISIDKK